MIGEVERDRFSISGGDRVDYQELQGDLTVRETMSFVDKVNFFLDTHPLKSALESARTLSGNFRRFCWAAYKLW